MDIKKEVKSLDINEAFKHLLSELISAQIFSIQKFYSPEISIKKYTQENDNRVWCEVILKFVVKDIALYQCRPFIDNGATMSANGDTITMRKTYFLYED